MRGSSTSPRSATIADEVGAFLLVDMAHFAGLVAGGVYPSPVPHAHVVTSTTHKTLRGPRGGLILCHAEYAKAIDKSVFPGNQGGPLEHVIAAKAVALRRGADARLQAYTRNRWWRTRKTLARCPGRARLRDRLGRHRHAPDAGGSPAQELTGKVAEELLGKAGITVNKNTIPDDPQKPFVTSGIRLGTPALTTRGMGVAEMRKVAELIDRVLTRPDDETIAKVHGEVLGLTSAYPLYQARKA